MEGNKEIIKQYRNEEITVTWQPQMCIHSTNCWKGLLDVFNPREKPWIQLEGTSSEKITNQIAQCPSKALSYTMNNL